MRPSSPASILAAEKAGRQSGWYRFGSMLNDVLDRGVKIPIAAATFGLGRAAEQVQPIAEAPFGKPAQVLRRIYDAPMGGAINYYSPDSSGQSLLDRDRKRILEQMALTRIGMGTADTSERVRKERMARIPDYFPASDLGSINDLNNPVPGIKARPKFVTGVIPMSSIHADAFYNPQIYTPANNDIARGKALLNGEPDSPENLGRRAINEWLWARNSDPQQTFLLNYLNPRIAALKDNQVLVLQNASAFNGTPLDMLVTKENGRVYQQLVEQDKSAPYVDAMRSGLPLSALQQVQMDVMGSPSQQVPASWQNALKGIPANRRYLDQVTFVPDLLLQTLAGSPAAAYVQSRPYRSQINVSSDYNDENRMPFIMSHEMGHVIDSGLRDSVITNEQEFLKNWNSDVQNAPNFKVNSNLPRDMYPLSDYYHAAIPGDPYFSQYGQDAGLTEGFGDIVATYLMQEANPNFPVFENSFGDPLRFEDVYPATANWFRTQLAGMGLIEPSFGGGPVRSNVGARGA